MTVEELEILVSASIEPALKEMKKLMPQIKQQVAQAVETAQKSMEQIDMKKVSNKIQQGILLVRKKIDNLKKSNKNNELAITVNNKEASKQISQLQKQIDSLQEKINSRQMKLNVITPKLDEITAKTTNEFTPNGVSSDNPAIQKMVNNSLSSNKEYNTLLTQEEKIIQEIKEYNTQLDNAKNKMSQLKQETSQTATTQNKMSSFFSTLKGKLGQTKPIVSSMKNIFSQIPKITQNITNNIKDMAGKMKQGLGHIIKYVGALFSIRGIYRLLSSSAQEWLGSQNAQAQQASANIEYMKYAMGSVFAPVVEYVINLVYQLMKAIQSLVYAFSGVNIFAKATASSMKSASKSAKDTNKSLVGVHSEINNVSEKDNNSGSGSATPSIDLSQVDTQLSPLAQKLYDFFKPLKESWDNYGPSLVEQLKTTANQVGGLISSVWGSVEKIITNGTVYSILQNILAIIGNIAEAFANVWNYNGNGDAIVQNLASAFNNLLIAINNVVQSDGFQEFLKFCSDKFKEISEKIASIDWKPLVDALATIGKNIGTIVLNVLNGLVDMFKWFAENPVVAEILLSIGIAIGIVAGAISLITTAIGIYNTVMPIATAVSSAFGISIGWLIVIIVAIVAAIAAVVLAIMNWDKVTKWLSETWEWIKQKAQEIWNAIADFFKNLWKGICDVATNIWNGIKDFFKGLWEGIKNTVMTVWNAIKDFFVNYFNTIKGIFEKIWNGIKNFMSNIFNGIKNVVSNVINGIKNTISNVLNGIKTVWNNIWNGLKTTVTNIFNGIWNTIKRVINSILGGIEGMANGIVKGVNTVINTLNKLKFDIPDWVPGLGGKTFGFNISLIPQVSLPRLAKGNVAYSETMAIFGEYAGASNNPEITTPQNIMAETFRDVLSDYEFNNNGNTPLSIAVYVGDKKLGDILIDNLRDKRRQTGQGIEALVGG